MKAITFKKYGSPDFLQLEEIPTPIPKDNELLICVVASSINSWDWEFQSGKTWINRLFYGLFKPKPTKRKLGSDIAGVVKTAGKNVTKFQPGDAVFGDLWDNWGGFAEYVCADENSVELMPTNLTFGQAAAVPQAGVLALQGLHTTGQIQAGQKVLINGAGGGVGTFAIQLAKLSNTEVTGVDFPEKLNTIRALGADHVIDCTQEDFTKTGRRYDLILDVQANRSMFDCKRALTSSGTYAIVGGKMVRIYQALILWLWTVITRDKRKLRLVVEGPNKGLSRLSILLQEGKLNPVIDSVYPLAELPKAMRHFRSGKHTGKIIISTNDTKSLH